MTPATMPVERVRALVRMLFPDHMTPLARRQILSVCDTYAQDPDVPMSQSPGHETGFDVSADVARLVADYWRDSALQYGDLKISWRLAAHPLCCVLAALDGETDPAQLGVESGTLTEAAILRLTAKRAST